ncbi:MAG: hypothetical protein M3498_15155 [Deinococcota bacterium]|nr:hypothetical protein [Deinococcota bacterium]
MRKALLTLLTLTFFLPSCATLHEPPRGRALSSHAGADFTGAALWSPGEDIFYRSFSSTTHRPTLFRVNAQTGISESLLEAGDVFSLQMSEDGDALFYLESCGGGEPGSGRGEEASSAVVRHSLSGGARERLLDCGVTTSFLSPAGFVLVGGGRLAYARGAEDAQASYLYDLATGEERPLGAGAPVAPSPDGSAVLLNGIRLEPYESPDKALWSIVPVDGGDPELLSLGLSANDSLFRIRWDAAGIRILFTRFDQEGLREDELFLRNVTTGQEQKVANAEGVGGPFMPPWSPDGNKIAFWTFVCLKEGGGSFLGPPSCEVLRSSLNVLELATGVRHVVDSSTQGGGGNVAFSSDGGKIAYGFGSSLYTSDLP